jgi:hypothetical protein
VTDRDFCLILWRAMVNVVKAFALYKLGKRVEVVEVER